MERLHQEVRDAFAQSLRNLQEENPRLFHLVIFGGKRLIELKYRTGIHSYFNTFDEQIIPPPSFEDWQKRYTKLSLTEYNEIIQVTGGDTKHIHIVT